MKLMRVVYALSLALFACDPGGSMAHVAQPGEVAGCKSLGDVSIDTDPDRNVSNEQSAIALRKKAASAGATHVVWAPGGADGMKMKGAMFKCEEPEKSETRADQRAGF